MSNIDQERYHKLAEWAESDDRDIHPDRALRGQRAAQASRELLRRAGGRPSIDPAPDAGGPAPRRQVRLPRSVSARVDEIASEQGRSPSDVMRDAISLYVSAIAKVEG
ncbi:MAG: ribbon-helix-helix protein, CopG family [Mycobacterium sp.]